MHGAASIELPGWARVSASRVRHIERVTARLDSARERAWTLALEAGCRFVDITPIRDDTFTEAAIDWIAPKPGSDAALMLALAHVQSTDVSGLSRHSVSRIGAVTAARPVKPHPGVPTTALPAGP